VVQQSNSGLVYLIIGIPRPHEHARTR